MTEVTEFLCEFKKHAQRKLQFIPRKENILTITYLGITYPEVKTAIFQLTYENYCDGPKEDKDKSGNHIWEFGVTIERQQIYIKLSDDFSCGIAKCLSFHIAKRALNYPFCGE